MAKAQSDAPAGRRAPPLRDDRLALVVFAGVLAVALVLYLVLAHDQWFFLDDWDFIALRRLGSLDDLFRPHNEHWTTLPIVVYRGLYHVFGTSTYVPYQLVSITLHLCVAALLLVVMRRSLVNPWIATAAASLFALFGAGSQDIVWAFQMVWSAALVLGLTHLLLADHDGPVDRRDWLGLAAGMLGLLCSGVAVTMVIVVGIAVLLRRGWRLAVLHTAPLALVYLIWWFVVGRDAYTATDPVASTVVRFVGTGIGATFDSLGQVPGVGVLLGLLVVVGLAIAWSRLPLEDLRQRASLPGAMLVGAVVFLVIVGLGRAAAFGPSFAKSGRYLHVVAALSIPAVARRGRCARSSLARCRSTRCRAAGHRDPRERRRTGQLPPRRTRDPGLGDRPPNRRPIGARRASIELPDPPRNRGPSPRQGPIAPVRPRQRPGVPREGSWRQVLGIPVYDPTDGHTLTANLPRSPCC